jgi:hypothetical protein
VSVTCHASRRVGSDDELRKQSSFLQTDAISGDYRRDGGMTTNSTGGEVPTECHLPPERSFELPVNGKSNGLPVDIRTSTATLQTALGHAWLSHLSWSPDDRPRTCHAP